MPAAQSYGFLLDALRGVTWPARRSARAATAGTHRSSMRGNSVEFSEYRAFRQGDDPRRPDWKLLARTDRAFLRITSERTTLPTVLLLDGSASMAYPLPSLGKWELACRLVVALASVAHASGDPVGMLLAVNGRVRDVTPSSRRDVVSAIARTLESESPAGAAPVAPLLARLRRGARIAIVSDFLGDDDALLRGVRELASAGSDVIAIHVVAREELEPRGGAFIAVDPEADDVRRALGTEARAGYRAAFDSWRGQVARQWREAGASYAEALTSEPPDRIVRRIVGAGVGESRRAEAAR